MVRPANYLSFVFLGGSLAACRLVCGGCLLCLSLKGNLLRRRADSLARLVALSFVNWFARQLFARQLICSACLFASGESGLTCLRQYSRPACPADVLFLAAIHFLKSNLLCNFALVYSKLDLLSFIFDKVDYRSEIREHSVLIDFVFIASHA